MSADNYIGVYLDRDKDRWCVSDGSMSVEMADCQYRGSVVSEHDSESEAVAAASKLEAETAIVEYGVIMLDPLPAEHCGRCWDCVNERGLAADDLERCAECKKPISDTEGYTVTHEGSFHSGCALRRDYSRADARA